MTSDILEKQYEHIQSQKGLKETLIATRDFVVFLEKSPNYSGKIKRLDNEWGQQISGKKKEEKRIENERNHEMWGVWSKLANIAPIIDHMNNPEKDPKFRINLKRENDLFIQLYDWLTAVTDERPYHNQDLVTEKIKYLAKQLYLWILTETPEVKGLTFDINSGTGEHNGKLFRFKKGGTKYHLFKKLYESRGKNVSRYDVLEILGRYEDGDRPTKSKQYADTKAISDASVYLRERTGLTTEQLIQDNGSLTLKI